MGGGTAKTLLTMSLSSHLSSLSRFSAAKRFTLLRPQNPTRVFLGFRPLCTSTPTTTTETVDTDESIQPLKHSILLERLRLRHLKDSAKSHETKSSTKKKKIHSDENVGLGKSRESNDDKKKKKVVVESFEELGLSEEVMGAVRKMGIEVPSEIQSIGIPAVLERKSVVLGSHTRSGKILAYMLPLVQLMRQNEAMFGMLIKPRHPRAVVLCSTRELSEQVFCIAKSISHHARFSSTMVSGGSRLRPQEDSLNGAIDMVVGNPGRVLQHIQDGNIIYGDIEYIVLRAVQNLIDEQFQGIVHLRTSTLHKKVASARHDFIKLSGSENKLEALLQVLEPSLAKGNKVMVFCNTLNSSRAVDHFLS